MSHRACSFSSLSPNTAARTSVSIVGELRPLSRATVTRPSRTPTSGPKSVLRASILSMKGGLNCPLNHIPGVRLRKQVPFLPSLVGVGPAEHRVGELLTQLDARLIEGIHAVQLASVNRRDLKEHHER